MPSTSFGYKEKFIIKEETHTYKHFVGFKSFKKIKKQTFSSTQCTTMDGYFLDSHLKNAGTPIFHIYFMSDLNKV